MSEDQRLAIIASMRAQIGYNDSVARFEPLFFAAVGVQLKDAYWQLEHRGVRFQRNRVLDHAVRDDNSVKEFAIAIPFCLMQPSPVRDMIRLIIPSMSPEEPGISIDIHPEQILYVTSVTTPPAEQQSGLIARPDGSLST
jgi:hypothetical protein